MATVVRFVGGPIAGQTEATDHRFRSAASRWRDHEAIPYQTVAQLADLVAGSPVAPRHAISTTQGETATVTPTEIIT